MNRFPNLKLNLFITEILVSSLVILLPMLSFAASTSSSSGPPTVLTQKELEKIAQPIALYPDLLLQQVLAASTFPEQILDAAIYNEQGKAPESIKDQPWDDSVKGVANYPSVLSKLASDLDWTITLGSAFINQNEQLRNAIQTLRARAKAVGNLKDSEKQNVVQEKSQNGTTIIRIEPVEPEIVYVPTTTTTIVYEEPVNQANLWAPVATFGLGMALGYAMGDDDDDHYYYGGGGYYGPGFWHGDAAEDWVDYRRDRWDDAYDFANDRQSWRQDNADDWREHRQDLSKKQQEWRSEQRSRAKDMSPEQRAQARSKVQGAKANRESTGTFSKSGSANYGSANVNRDAASQRLNQAKSNPDLQKRAESYRSSPQVQQRAQSARSNYQSGQGSYARSQNRGGGLSGMGSGGYSVNRSQTRGSISRGSYGGASRGGGGFSRGGGGGRRR